MVIIKGIEANRVPNPRMMRIEQITSAKTTSTKVKAVPNPNGSANLISSLNIYYIIFFTRDTQVKFSDEKKKPLQRDKETHRFGGL